VVDGARFRAFNMQGALLEFAMACCTEQEPGDLAELIGDAKSSNLSESRNCATHAIPTAAVFLGYLLYKLLLIAPLSSEIGAIS
jgi:hypothetical protein